MTRAKQWSWYACESGRWIASSPKGYRCEVQRLGGQWRWRKNDAPPAGRAWHTAESFKDAQREMRKTVA